jgi:type VI secretion system protein ImpK
MAPSANVQRSETLALLYQEVLTAIVRLRANRQGVTDAQSFRYQTHTAINNAGAQALAAGYAADDVKMAAFAVVAFLDESVLNSQNPSFADWLRKPLQEEIFGTHMAGELFFRNLQQLLGRSDSPDLGDLLEVYYLCLLLGFGGRYSGGGRGELGQAARATGEKIARIRGRSALLSPAWALPSEAAVARRDPWVRRLGIAAVVCAALMVALFVVFQVVLSSGARVGA